MVKQFDIIGIGASLIEQIAHVHRLPDNPTDVCASLSYQHVEGGGLSNMLIGLNGFGLKAGYFGKLAGDGFGVQITKGLVNAGIDIGQCDMLPSALSPWIWTVSDDAGRTSRVFFPNILSQIDAAYVAASSYYLRNCRLLLIELCGIPLEACILAAELVKASSIPVVTRLSLSQRDLLETLQAGTLEQLEETLAFSDVFMTDIAAGRELSGEDAPEKIVATLREKHIIPIVSLFDEREGSFWAAEDEVFHQPPFAVAPVDMAGHADAFGVGLTFGILRGWNIRETARFAQACAALHAMKPGTRAAMPFEAEVQKFLEVHP